MCMLWTFLKQNERKGQSEVFLKISFLCHERPLGSVRYILLECKILDNIRFLNGV